MLLHLLCLALKTSLLQCTKFSPRQKREILNEHNFARSRVFFTRDTPPPSSMRMLSWDADLEDEADRIAMKCKNKHERGRVGGETYGQNLYIDADVGTGKSLEDRMKGEDPFLPHYLMVGWVQNEKRALLDEVLKGGTQWEWKRIGAGLNAKKTLDHYSQCVWDRTSRVGCAYSLCRGQGQKRGRYVVCNYLSAGNLVTEAGESLGWYEVGPPCSNCPPGYICDLTLGLCAPSPDHLQALQEEDLFQWAVKRNKEREKGTVALRFEEGKVRFHIYKGEREEGRLPRVTQSRENMQNVASASAERRPKKEIRSSLLPRLDPKALVKDTSVLEALPRDKPLSIPPSRGIKESPLSGLVLKAAQKDNRARTRLPSLAPRRGLHSKASKS